ncbi:MAG: glycosyltransferase [Fimbriimonadales bacterium]|nr:glycosyltransferase [Fimbriimonadales bacterium]MDW8052149.1 glycosyltransferase [Armatimonadota bacterium]
MQGPKVVFQIINSLSVGGAERVVVDLLRYMDRERYQPICICTSYPHNTHYEVIVSRLGVPLYYLHVSSKPLNWVHNKALDELMRRYRPTVVHTHQGAIRHALPLAVKHRTPVRLHTLHSLAEYEMVGGTNKLVRILAFRYRIGSFIPVAIAQEVARTIEAVYGYKNPPVIPNGISVEEYTPNLSQRLRFRQEYGIQPDAVVVVHVGRFAGSKNHSLLLQAFARLRCKQPVYLWLVGGGELLESMQQLARELGVAERVRFWGVRSDVPALLNAADIFTLPSRYEGNPLSVMEAMAAGLPVVATAVGGVPELVEEGVSGFLTPNEDVEALTAALQRLVDNAELRRQMGEAALRRARERFDVRHTVRAYEALYEEILQRRRR